MNVSEKLEILGFTGNEIRVYLDLFDKGELSANQIAKNIGMDRTLTYTVLNHLIEKGQVNYIIKEGKKYFSCSNPENLINSLKAKETIVNDLIVELKRRKKKEQKETDVNIYEGKDGLRAIMKLMMNHKEFCSFGVTGRAYDYIYETPALAKEWEKSKSRGRLITNNSHKNHEMTQIKKIEFRYLDIKSEVTTSIFGNYIAIQQSINKPIIILIKDKHIADSYQNHFEILWKAARV